MRPRRHLHGVALALCSCGCTPRTPKTDEETYRPMDRDALTATAKLWLRPAAKRLPAGLRSRMILNRPGRRVRWGSLRRTRPFSDCYGFDRGLPIDRYY